MKTLDDFNIKTKKPWEVEGVEWREVRLGDKMIAGIIMGQSPPSSSYNKEGKGVPFLQGNKEFGRFHPKHVMFTTDPKKMAKKGDILLSVRAPVGDVNIADKEYCIGRGLAAIRFNGEPKYLFYLFVNIKEDLEELGRRGTTFKAITKNHLKNLKIPIPFRNGKPDLETQKKIVEYIEANFSSIDKILEKKKKELEQLDELWESILEQAFKPKEGEEWREVRLGEICIINPKKSEVRHLLEQNIEVSFIPMDHVDDIQGKIIKQEIKPINSVYRGYTYFKERDILFAKITPCMENGKSAVACNLKNGIGFGSTEFHVLRPKEKVLSEFIFYFIRRKRFRNLAKLHFTGTVGHKRVPKEFLINAKIPIPFRNNQPDLEKQKEIASYLDGVYEKIKSLKEKIQNQISQLEEMKESILDEVFNHEEVG